MQTLKIKIETENEKEIFEYQRQYSIVLRVCFNYIKSDYESSKLGSLFDYKVLKSGLMQKIKELKNIELLKNWLIQSAISEAYQLFNSYLYRINEYNQKLKLKEELLNKDKRIKKEIKQLRKLFKVKYPKVIFGGKNNFFSRQPKDLNTKPITKEQFKLHRLNPIYSIGMNATFANRLFRINQDLNSVTFQPKCKEKYIY